MISNKNQKEFQLVASKMREALGWEVESCCPNCKVKILEDAFRVIRFLGGIEEWWCPNCTVEKHEGAVIGHRVGCWNMEGTFPPDFYKCLRKFEQLYLEGYLIGYYHFFPQLNPLSEIKVFSDLSIAIPRLYSANEVFLQETIIARIYKLKAMGKLRKEIIDDPRSLNVNQCFQVMKTLNIVFDKKLKKKVMSCGTIRNNIMHKGYAPIIDDFMVVLADVGLNVAYIQKNNI